MYYLTRPSWNTPGPNTSPPALHDARYDGWPNPPIQLPHFAPPSFNKPAGRRVTFATDTPSNRRPRDGNATHTRKQLFMHVALCLNRHQNLTRSTFNMTLTHVQILGCKSNTDTTTFLTRACGTVALTRIKALLICAPQLNTTRRTQRSNVSVHGPHSFSCNCQDVQLRTFLDGPVRQTKASMSLIDKDTQIAYPLAAPCVPLVYDLRYPPNSFCLPPSSPYEGQGSEFLRVPPTPVRHNQIRLISQDFPWAFNIGPAPGAAEQVVTCLDVLTALHAALQRPLSDTEWGAAAEDKHASLIRARDRRLNMKPALRGSSSTGTCTTTRPRVRFASDVDTQPARREPSILRVDWLGSRVMFGGLVKDETFAKRRLIPGAREPPFMYRLSRFWDMKLVHARHRGYCSSYGKFPTTSEGRG